MIALPKELIGMTDYDEDDNWILKDEATEEQRKIFEEFKKSIEEGKLSDTLIEYEK